MLSQLSYVPLVAVQSDRIGRTLYLLVGVPRLELGTSALSGLRSNQLSYTPNLLFIHKLSDFLSRLYDVRSHAVLAHRAAIAEELFINHTLLWVNGPFWLGTQADIYYCRVRTG